MWTRNDFLIGTSIASALAPAIALAAGPSQTAQTPALQEAHFTYQQVTI